MDDLFIHDGIVGTSIVTSRGQLGKYIAKIRVDLSLTQNQLAKLIGISGSTLSAIENRKKPISKKQIDNFIKEMGLDATEQLEFTKLAIMHNVAIEAEKIQRNMFSGSE